MKILFINPPDENTLAEYPDEDGDEFLGSDDFGYFPPLGLLYVLSYLEANTTGHELFFKDCVAEKISHEMLGPMVRAIQPDVVGITSFTISLIDVLLVARKVRAMVPHAHICLGGHHPIAFPLEAALLPEFDSTVVGEGEIAFTELIQALETGKEITGITGVYTQQSIQEWQENAFQDKRFLTTVTVPPAYVQDLDALPIPNRNYIKHTNYKSTVGITGNLATIISSRGCPYQCTFCDVPYKRYRSRSIALVLDEVEACLAMGYQEFHFYDDLFNITAKKVIAFCDEVERRKLHFIWDFRGRVNNVTKESLIRAKKAGLRMVSFGVETGTDTGLKALKKGVTTNQFREVFSWCRELGIKTIADYMIGLPFERSKEDIERNIDFLLELDPDYAQVGILCLYPNTPLYEDAIAKGFFPADKWNKFAVNPSTDFKIDHWEEFLTTGELVQMQKNAYKRFYLRPKYIIRNILSTRTFYEFMAKAKGVLQLLR